MHQLHEVCSAGHQRRNRLQVRQALRPVRFHQELRDVVSVFWKQGQYSDQREFRFAIDAGSAGKNRIWPCHESDSSPGCVTPSQYLALRLDNILSIALEWPIQGTSFDRPLSTSSEGTCWRSLF